MKISDLMNCPATRTSAMEFLGHLTVAELESRLAKIEAMGQRNAAKVARGDLGEVTGSHVRKGQHVATRAHVAALNGQRRAWAQTAYVLRVKRGA